MSTLLDSLFEQDGFDGGIQFLLDVFEQYRLPESDAVLQGFEEVALRQLGDLEVALLTQTLDPLVGLPLRVDDEGPSPAIEDEDAIIDRQVISWQSCLLPLPNLNLFS